MARETRTLTDPEIRACIEKRDDGTPDAIVGYGAVFYNGKAGTQFDMGTSWDGRRYVERVADNAFDRALDEKDDCRGLVNHDPNWLLGRTSAGTMTLEKDTRGLKFRIPVDAADPDHMRAVRKIERGDLSGCSFSFEVESRTIEETEDAIVRILTGVRLYDVGPVTFPAYEGTETSISKRDAAGALQDLEEYRQEHAADDRDAMDVQLGCRAAQQKL